MHGAQEHFGNLDPIQVVVGRHEGLQLVAPLVRGRPVVQVRGQPLEQPNRNVAAREAQPLEQEASCELNAEFVGAPGVEAVLDKLFNVAETLGGGLVEVLALFNLLKEPGLDEGTATNHDRVDARVGDVLVVVLVGVAVAVAEEVEVPPVGEGAGVGLGGGVGEAVLLVVVALDEGGAVGDEGPVGFFRVALLAAAAVEGDGGAAGGAEAVALLAGAKGQLLNDLVGGGTVVADTGADLGGDGDLAREGVHAADHALELAVGLEQGGAGAVLVDHVNGAAAVEVDEAEVGDEAVEDVGHLGCYPGLVGRDLGAEAEVAGVVVVVDNVGGGGDGRRRNLGLVGLEEGPVGLVALDHGHAHGHLGVGQLGAELDAETAEREVALSRQGCEGRRLGAKVEATLLGGLKGWIDKLGADGLEVLLGGVAAGLVVLVGGLGLLVEPLDVLVGLLEVGALAVEVGLDLHVDDVVDGGSLLVGLTPRLRTTVIVEQAELLAAVVVLDLA